MIALKLLNLLTEAIESMRQSAIRRVYKKMMRNVHTSGLFLEATEKNYTLKNLSFTNLSELNQAMRRMHEFGYDSDFFETMEDMTAKAIFKDYDVYGKGAI